MVVVLKFTEDTIMSKNQNASKENRVTTPLSVESILFDLWERNADRFTIEELEEYQHATEQAQMLAQNLEDTLSGLGCLISDDIARHEEKKPYVGVFHSQDLPALLFFVAKNLSVIRGLVYVGESSAFKLTQLHKEQNLK